MLRRSRGARGPARGSTSNARILDFGKESADVALLFSDSHSTVLTIQCQVLELC